LQNLKVASRKTKITLVYGKSEMKREERDRLTQIDNLSLYFLDNLHAKCFFNEDAMVITSFNMYESSLKNREMGVLITVRDDPDCFKNATEEADRIVDSAEEVKLRGAVLNGAVKMVKSIADSVPKDESKRPKSRSYSSKPRTKKEGYCIRCKTSIPYNLDSPYCRDCWKKWKEGGENPDYIERHGSCHTCGRPAPTSKARPQCISCYKPRK